MPLPAELEGKKLVGSTWIRRLGKHRGFRWTLESFNDAGVKLLPNKQDLRGWKAHMGDHKITSLQWPMFMNLYQPEGILQPMIVTTDKEGFVLAVAKEPTNGVMKAIDSPAAETAICRGPWHYRSGKGTELPIAEFSILGPGKNQGQRAKMCNGCRKRQRDWEQEDAIRKGNGRVKVTNNGNAFFAQVEEADTPPAKVEKVTIKEALSVLHDTLPAVAVSKKDSPVIFSLEPDGTPEWEITVEVVRVVEEKRIVRAKDLLDLAAMTEGEKVTSVRRV